LVLRKSARANQVGERGKENTGHQWNKGKLKRGEGREKWRKQRRNEEHRRKNRLGMSSELKEEGNVMM
jgi:hypothetical protein